MNQITVSVDLNKALEKLGKTKEELTKEVPRALNKVGDFGRTWVARRIREMYGARVGALKKRLEVKRATSNSTMITIRATGKKINWIYFDAREVAGGVSVKDRKGRKLLQDAFIVTLNDVSPNGGNKFVVKRMAGSRHVSRRINPKGSDLKITLLSGPSVANMFRTTIREDQLRKVLRDRFPGELAEAIRSLKYRTR